MITSLKALCLVITCLAISCSPPVKEKEHVRPEDFPYVACNCATACLNDEGVMIVNTLVAAHRNRF